MNKEQKKIVKRIYQAYSKLYILSDITWYILPELKKFIKIKVSTTALKTIDKYGLLPYLKKEGLSLRDIQ